MFGKLRDIFGGGAGEVGFTSVKREAGPEGEVYSGALIRLEGIGKTFQIDDVQTHALRDVNLEVQRGEFVAVNGPSGSGKTTLLSICGLLEAPTSGTYTLNGHDVSHLPASARAAVRNREIGFIFQSFNLIGDLTVYENVELPLTYLGLPAGERRERVTVALERVDMADRARQMPAQLSGGQQQRVAVARAVVGEPEIILADEPTGNLNSHQAETVIAMLEELHAAGATILLVTHDPRWQETVQRSVELFDGTIVA
ncbi:MAG: ABC transporter ATP-binding protein [Acidobacteriota bacterium]|jgi:putative ABC transport system ATP-binding protein